MFILWLKFDKILSQSIDKIIIICYHN